MSEVGTAIELVEQHVENFVSMPEPTEEARRLWRFESALERIANSKHGDANWMRNVARKALAGITEETFV